MRMPMPTEFLHKQKTDIMLLQEVTPIVIGLISGYNAYTNVGINKRGNAMLNRQTIKNSITLLNPGGELYRIYIHIYIYTLWVIE